MRNSTRLLFLLIVISFFFTDCKKKGCTDPDSTTFDEDAKKDDGSCNFVGYVVFWYGSTTSEGLIANGAAQLNFYIDGSFQGQLQATKHWSVAPACDDNNVITYSKDLGSVKSRSVTYSVKDQTGYEYCSGSITVEANTCEKVEVIWP